MTDNLLEQGLILLIFGIGTVFLFLTLLVFATEVMSRVIIRWFPESEGVPAPLSVAAGSTNIIRQVAVTAAIHHHRTSVRAGKEHDLP